MSVSVSKNNNIHYDDDDDEKTENTEVASEHPLLSTKQFNLFLQCPGLPLSTEDSIAITHHGPIIVRVS